MTNPSRIRRHALAAAIGVLLAATNPALAADAALEARVAELEQQVQELVAELRASRSAPPAATATAAAAAPAVASTPAPGAAPPVPPPAASLTPNAAPGTRFLVTGFVKLDALASSYGDGEIADGSVGRDFYVPAAIPVGGEGEDVDLDAHIKQSRLTVGTDSLTERGDRISSRLEVDLYGNALGDERATNTYGVQVRQAYVAWNEWLAGQTWSNFQDINALPEAIDYIGPTDGTVFVRQPQLRYTHGGWSFSLENPETTLTPYGGGARISSDDNSVPDATARYTWSQPWGYLSGALLGRQLKYETTAGADPLDDSAYALAATLSGKFLLGDGDDIRFAVTGGQGIGRYVALNFANDAVLDAEGALETIDGIAGYAAWRHLFSPRLRGNLMASASDYRNDAALTGGAVNAASWAVAGNLIWTILPKLDLGIEYRHARREIENGDEGTLDRLQFTTKYSF